MNQIKFRMLTVETYHRDGYYGYHRAGYYGYHRDGYYGYHRDGYYGYHRDGYYGYHRDGYYGYHRDGTMVTIGMVTFMGKYISHMEQSTKIKFTMLSPYNGARMTTTHTNTIPCTSLSSCFRRHTKRSNFIATAHHTQACSN